MTVMDHTELFSNLEAERHALGRHPVYEHFRTLDDLRVFMSHHVYAVWDFMSLLKSLQAILAPDGIPWAPNGDPVVRRFINDIVREEESDRAPWTNNGEPTYASHFELYCEALREVGVDPDPVLRFAAHAAAEGIEAAFAEEPPPAAAQRFIRTTFGFIETRRPHVIAAAFSWGRENIIPSMFTGLLEACRVPSEQTPVFTYYLRRHMHLDQKHHGPMSARLTDLLCQGDPERLHEVETIALEAMAARHALWDAVRAQLPD